MSVPMWLTAMLLLHPSTVVAHSDHPVLEAAPVDETTRVAEAALRLSMAPATAVVGTLSGVVAELKLAGQLVPTKFSLEVRNEEEQEVVFASTVAAASGAFTWHIQFYDGAPHRLGVKAEALRPGAFPTVTTSVPVTVTAVPPPAAVIFRTLAGLVLFTAAAMLGGYVAARVYFRRREFHRFAGV